MLSQVPKSRPGAPQFAGRSASLRGPPFLLGRGGPRLQTMLGLRRIKIDGSGKSKPNPEFRVLIVDDEIAVADSLAMVFCAGGYDARAAYSAEDAAEIVSQWEPRLAIVDVVLPGMNGIDFAIQLENSCPDCHVLLFSGDQSAASLIQEALTKGREFKIFAKPVPPLFFLEEAARLC